MSFHVLSLGATLQDGLREVVEEYGLPAEVVGYPISPFLQFASESEHAKVRFFAETARCGVFFHPNHQWFLSGAHTESDIDFTLEACRRAASIAVA